MSVSLKNDWKPVGNSPGARRLADWMNMVANQFNYANVPSGGTAQPTSQGFQIEVDGEGQQPLPFDARIVDGNLEVYGLGVANVVNHNAAAIPTGFIGPDPEWTDIGSATTGTYSLYVRMPTADDDYTNASNLQWTVATTPPDGGTRNIPSLTRKLFTITSENEIVQHRRGAIGFNRKEGDSDAKTFAGSPSSWPTTQRSIESRGDNFQIRNYFDASLNEISTDLDSDDRDLVTLICRDARDSADVDVKYLSINAIKTIIEQLIDFPYPDPPPDYDPEAPEQEWSDWWGSHPHNLLKDVQDQTVGDDHRGGRDAATGLGEENDKHPYIHANGDATRNAMDGVIGDSSGGKSIEPDLRSLNGPSGDASVFWDDPGIEVPDGKDYYHNAKQGVTVADWISGGILIGSDIQEISASELLDTDKILVRRSA
jgi:hypothetical protein